MPAWTLSEMTELRNSCFADTVNQATMLRRFNIYSGNPRLVLARAPLSRSDGQQLEEALVRAQDLRRVLQLADQGLTAEGEIPSALLRLVPDFGASSCKTRFASEYVGEAVYRRYAEQVRLEMKEFVLFGEGISPIATARGWVFERLCHDVLPRGDATALEPLGRDGRPEDFPVAKSKDEKAHVFTDLADMVGRSMDGITYCRPDISNFESIDGIIYRKKIVYMLQITVAKKHSVKVHGLELIWQAYMAQGVDVQEMRLVFVLPASVRVRDDFVSEQTYTYTKVDDTTYRGPLPAFMKKVTQWRCFAAP
jgi:hypothetical protein